MDLGLPLVTWVVQRFVPSRHIGRSMAVSSTWRAPAVARALDAGAAAEGGARPGQRIFEASISMRVTSCSS